MGYNKDTPQTFPSKYEATFSVESTRHPRSHSVGCSRSDESLMNAVNGVIDYFDRIYEIASDKKEYIKDHGMIVENGNSG